MMPKDYAMAYLRKGLSVVPIIDKWPPFEWKQYQTTKATKAEVESWYVSYKKAGVGVVTGPISNLLVLDIDTYKGGSKSVEGKAFPVTPTARSARGGMHYYFRWPKAVEPVATSKRELLPGVDIRGAGGLCVLPPSRGASGSPYKWISGRDLLSCPLANAPKWLIDLILQAPKVFKYEGPRHPEFVRLFSAHMAKGLTLPEVEAKMREWNEEINANPFDEERFQKEFKGIAKPWLDGRYMSKDTRAVLEAKAAKEVKSISADEFLASANEKIVWHVDGIVPKQAMVLLGGEPKVGKSWLLLDLAAEMGLGGGMWLGQFKVGAGKVLYIDQENAEQLLKFRLRKVVRGKGVSKLENVFVVTTRGLKVDREAGYAALEELLERHQPDLVMCDALIRFHSGDENSASSLRDVHEAIAKLVQKYKCSFLFTDHEKKAWVEKDGERKEKPGSLRGSSEKEAFADAVLSLVRRKNGNLKLYHTYSRWCSPVEPVELSIVDLDKNRTVVKVVEQL